MKPKNPSPQIMIVAAEESSCLYAQRLLEHWKNQEIPIKAFGVGNKAMEELGFERLGKAEDLAVVGLFEIASHFSSIKDVFYKLIDECEKRRPSVVLLMDYPEFNFRLAKKIKKLNIPVVYYISPQIWAWRSGRIKFMKKYIDQVLLLFPFEKQFYSSYNVKNNFVGHPLLDELDPKLWDKDFQNLNRRRFGIQDKDFLIGLMPGSRRGEIKYHLQDQLAVAQKLKEKHPHVKIALFLAPSLNKKDIAQKLQKLDFELSIIQTEPFEMIGMADLILCASGTATLMVGLLSKPMVIMYKMNAFSGWLARKIVKSKYFGLVNIVFGKEVVRELFQKDASVDRLFTEMDLLVRDEEKRTQLSQTLSEVKLMLGDRGVTPRVAKALGDYFEN